MTRLLLKFCVLTIFLCSLHREASAQWQAMIGTARFKVSYEKQSIKSASFGRLEMRFHFIPRGEAERKSAASDYSSKRYRSHLEYYEIDCSKQTALLGMIDILGASKVRIKRLQGNSYLTPILLGSVLENAVQYICPVLDKEEKENEDVEQTEESDTFDKNELSTDKLNQIEHLQKKTISTEATAEAWKELGNIYFDTDQPEQAIKAYEKALVLSPDDTDTLNDQGAMYRQIGNFEQALKNFEKAYSINPTNLESLYNSGYVCAFDMNNIPKALVLWRRYLDQESKSETARKVQSFVEQYEK